MVREGYLYAVHRSQALETTPSSAHLQKPMHMSMSQTAAKCFAGVSFADEAITSDEIPYGNNHKFVKIQAAKTISAGE